MKIYRGHYEGVRKFIEPTRELKNIGLKGRFLDHNRALMLNSSIHGLGVWVRKFIELTRGDMHPVVQDENIFLFYISSKIFGRRLMPEMNSTHNFTLKPTFQ